MCRYPACNSEIHLPLHPEYHHAQPKSVIFKMWKQFSSRLALLQVPSQHKCLSEAGSGQLHCGVEGLVCSALEKPPVALSVLGRKPSQPSASEFPFPKSLAVIKHLDVLQMLRTGTRRNNFDSFLLLIALPPN